MLQNFLLSMAETTITMSVLILLLLLFTRLFGERFTKQPICLLPVLLRRNIRYNQLLRLEHCGKHTAAVPLQIRWGLGKRNVPMTIHFGNTDILSDTRKSFIILWNIYCNIFIRHSFMAQ